MPIVQPDNTGMMLFAQNLLNNYTGNNSWWRRLFTGKWRRSHLYDVNVLLDSLSATPSPIRNIVDLLGRLHLLTTKANYNRQGALARCIEQIWDAVMSNNSSSFALSANNTDTGYVRNENSKINLLTVAMEQKRHDHVKRIFEWLETADIKTQINTYHCTLIQMMGVNYRLQDWILDIPALTTRPNERVDYHYLAYLPDLLAAIKHFTFEQKKQILLPGLIEAVHLTRQAEADLILNALFEGCEQPTNVQKRWLFEKMIDYKPTVLNVLDEVIHADRIDMPEPPLYSDGTLFPPCTGQDLNALNKLTSLTGVSGWRKISGGKHWLTAELSIAEQEQGLIQTVSAELRRLVDFGILHLNQFVQDSRVFLRCSRIDTLQLGMVKSAEEPLLEPDNSHYSFE